MFTDEAFAKLEAAARRAFVENKIPMFRGQLGLSVRDHTYQITTPQSGCCITAAVVLGEPVRHEQHELVHSLDDAYTLAGEKLGVSSRDINALWMCWDFAMDTTQGIPPQSSEDTSLLERLMLLINELVDEGAEFSQNNDD
jgi:hypothetical protein